MSNQPKTDSDWLMQRMPDATEAQEEEFIERVAIMLERTIEPSWARVEYVRLMALECMR